LSKTTRCALKAVSVDLEFKTQACLRVGMKVNKVNIGQFVKTILT